MDLHAHEKTDERVYQAFDDQERARLDNSDSCARVVESASVIDVSGTSQTFFRRRKPSDSFLIVKYTKPMK